MSLLSRLAVEAARGFGLFSKKGGVSASYLAVAGGGGSGGGGGGAGGYQTSTLSLSTLNTYTITVGAGGAGVQCVGGGTSGLAGSNSVISGTGISTITSIGGGYGGGGVSGGNGGSGGGAGSSGSSVGPGTGTSGQGNNGGYNIYTSSPFPAGGGGGAGAVGGSATSATQAGNGGAGLSSSISGSSITYAGGGGGGYYTTGGNATTGGSGGGGAGNSNTGNGVSGTANLGGGGGGTGTAYFGGSGGSGIVIISYTSATPLFVGGTITTSGGNQIHTFTSSGTLTPVTQVSASYLVVAGGGGGGTDCGAGGGAGGYQTSTTTLYYPATYIVTVGSGGAVAATSSVTGTNGSNSVLSGTGLTTITSVGGGGGGSISSRSGANGGSGGGGTNPGGAAGSGTSGQGNAGGISSGTQAGGGGGGAGAVGSNSSSSNTGGAGGNGSASSISGSSVTYAGGGGGGGYSGTNSSGGTGGGGQGSAIGSPNTSTAGTTNTGGGGGGGGGSNAAGQGSNGGSGVVIISYAGSQVFNGGTVTTSGGNTIHTFYATGALTPITNNLTNSLRFRASASAYLSRTPTIAGSQTTWTWSAWVKRGTLGVQQKLFTAGSSGSLFASFEFIAGDNLQFYAYNGATNAYLVTTQVFRDPSAWYHIVWAIDTTQATAANRMKLYVNGNQVTAFSTSTYPSQNFAFPINNNVIHNIGRDNINNTNYLDGYLTDINFIDGQQLESYYFGSNDSNNVWKPIKYYGTYGTNGFYLTFGNTTSTTTLGYDSSPNGNNWTTNNISLTAGTTYDAMTDVPTLTSATAANYAVLNPISPASISATLSEANLKATGIGSGTFESAISTMSFTSGKIYFEATCLSGTGVNASTFIGITNISNATSGACFTNSGSGSIGWDVNGTTLYTIINTTLTSRGAITPTNKVFRVAYDSSTGNIWLGYDTTWIGGGDPSTGSTPTGTLTTGVEYIAGATLNTSNDSIAVNFGQRPFAQTIPTGYVALNTYNLPTPTIIQGNRYMDATLYTGTGTAQVITNASGFKPDLVWGKPRSTASSNLLYDSVRGALYYLSSNSTAAEAGGTADTGVTSFNSNGFSLGSAAGYLNGSGATNVAWQWQAGQGTTSSNTSGSITSTVSVNATAGFSVITGTFATVSSQTVGHGLGVAPAMYIMKKRNNVGDWATYHKSLGATKGLSLNTTDAALTNIGYFNNTEPTSSVVSFGSYFNSTNTFVVYAWAEIAGFSKFGSYTGNGSADGPFVYLGFRPKFIMIKTSTAATQQWNNFDTGRNTYNSSNNVLFPNLSNAESTSEAGIDILSNGFKCRDTNGNRNNSGATYIYAAFAENPFRYSNAR